EKNQSAEKPRLPRPRSANERGRIASPRPPHIPYAAAIAVIHCPTRVRYSANASTQSPNKEDPLLGTSTQYPNLLQKDFMPAPTQPKICTEATQKRDPYTPIKMINNISPILQVKWPKNVNYRKQRAENLTSPEFIKRKKESQEINLKKKEIGKEDKKKRTNKKDPTLKMKKSLLKKIQPKINSNSMIRRPKVREV
ncbi:hypothetical protein J6590_104913, partial [Homalodisca vitripennis]